MGKKIRAIAAVSLNGVIGNGLQIPWHIPEDFKHFKKTTLGGIIVMGRKTWESLGAKPLPKRENVVITSTPEKIGAGAKAFKSFEDFLSAFADDPRNIWVCGGASLYKSALPHCSEIILSRVKFSPRGDIFFPNTRGAFKKADTIKKCKLFNVVRYVAIKNASAKNAQPAQQNA